MYVCTRPSAQWSRPGYEASILGDWQVLGGDPCNQFSNTSLLNDDITSSSLLVFNNGSCHCSQQPLSSDQFVSCQSMCVSQQCQLLEVLATELMVGDNGRVCLLPSPLDDDERLHCLWSEHHLVYEGPIDPSGDSCTHECVTDLLSNTSSVVFITDQPSLPISLCEICDNSTICPVDLSSCDSLESSNHSECVCQAYSTVPGYSCFWNQVSRVTGERCERCPPVCLSENHSLHLAQLIIGLLLFTPGFPIGRLTITLILSDIIGRGPQGFVMSMLVATGSVARITGPLWGNQVYLLANRRTWLLMLILAVMQLLVLTGFILLYRKMTPNKDHSSAEDKEEDRVELLSFTEETQTDQSDNSSSDSNIDQNDTTLTNYDNVL